MTMSSTRENPTVLLTGFEPFGTDEHNPSADVAEATVEALGQSGIRAVSAVLPCTFATSHEALFDLIERHEPDVVICLGLAAGRAKVGVEQVAINLQQARISDNAGFQPNGTSVVVGGPDGIFTTLPARRIVSAAGELPVELSLSAGTFVCNHLFYALMHAVEKGRWGERGPQSAGFVHVPWDTDVSRVYPGIPLSESVAGVHRVVVETLEFLKDPGAPEADTTMGAGLGTLH